MLVPATRHYPNAPITEAVIDLRVQPHPQLIMSTLLKVREGNEAQYPTMYPVNEVYGSMQFAQEKGFSTTASSQQIGYMFRSADEKQILQARTTGFSMSQLAPYPHWPPFCIESRRRWDIYRNVAQPEKIVRIAVRYINRIDIPLPIIDFGEYLRTVPQVSPDLPQGLKNYFMQLEMPLDEIKSYAIINQMMGEQQTRPDIVSIVLDIDIFRVNDLPTTEDEIWVSMEELRHAKNSVFEACITDKARELFQ